MSPQNSLLIMESCIPQVLEEMLFLLLELLVHLIVLFLQGIAHADLVTQSLLLIGRYILLILTDALSN